MTSPHYHVLRREGADKLVVFVTATRAKTARLDKFDFWGVGRELNTHCLYINNGPRNEWYQAGIPGLGDDVDTTVSAIQEIARELGVRETVFIGVSMGGYGALLYALKSGNRALAFGPETKVGLPASRSARMIYPGTVIRNGDLSEMIKAAKAPVTILAAQRDPIDIYCMSLLDGLPNCRLHPLRSVSHGVAGTLSLSGRLVPLLDKFIAGEDIPPLKEQIPLDVYFAESFYNLHRAIEDKRFDDALAISIDPEVNDQALILIAKAHMGLRRYEQALAYLYRAKKKQMTKEVSYLIGHCYRRMKEFDHAILAHKQSTEKWPTDPKPLQDLTLIYEEIGNLPEARRYGLAAAKIIPTHAGHMAALQRIEHALDESKNAPIASG